MTPLKGTGSWGLFFDGWYVFAAKHAVAVLGILIRHVIPEQRRVEDLLTLVAHPELQIGESADGVMPYRGIGLARLSCLDHQECLGIGAGRSHECEQRAVEDVGIGALIAVEGLRQQAQVPSPPLFMVLGRGREKSWSERVRIWESRCGRIRPQEQCCPGIGARFLTISGASKVQVEAYSSRAAGHLAPESESE